MKRYLELLVQLGLFVAAVLVALRLQGHIERWWSDATQVDLDIRVSAISLTLYLVAWPMYLGILRIPPLRRRFDPSYRFAGEYMSFPDHDPDAVDIFVIECGFFSRQYRLEGKAYSLRARGATGSWSSSSLTMSTSPSSLVYTYSGNSRPAQKKERALFVGQGFCKITFNATDLLNGRGYFLDIDEGADLVPRRHSNYLKVDDAVLAALKRRRGRGSDQLFQAFLELSPDKRTSFRRTSAGRPTIS